MTTPAKHRAPAAPSAPGGQYLTFALGEEVFAMNIDHVREISRTPRGHPEGLLEAFANLYREAAEAIHARNAGAPLAQVSFPTIDDGVESMRFIEACIASHAAGGRWIGT